MAPHRQPPGQRPHSLVWFPSPSSWIWSSPNPSFHNLHIQALVKPNHSQPPRHCAHLSLHAFAHPDSSTFPTPPPEPAHPHSLLLSSNLSSSISPALPLAYNLSRWNQESSAVSQCPVHTVLFVQLLMDCVLGLLIRLPLLDQELQAHHCSFIPNTNTRSGQMSHT